MPKYKVGDVAALFPKPSAPKTESGKKLQSLFDEFYGKSNSKKFKTPNQSPLLKKVSAASPPMNENITQSDSKKRKRKFKDLVDSTANLKAVTPKTHKKPKLGLQDTFEKSERFESVKTGTNAEAGFPRSKKKFKLLPDFESNEDSYSQYDSQEPCVEDLQVGKKKKQKKAFNSESELDSSMSHIPLDVVGSVEEKKNKKKKKKKNKNSPLKPKDNDIEFSHSAENASVEKEIHQNVAKKGKKAKGWQNDPDLPQGDQKGTPKKKKRKTVLSVPSSDELENCQNTEIANTSVSNSNPVVKRKKKKSSKHGRLSTTVDSKPAERSNGEGGQEPRFQKWADTSGDLFNEGQVSESGADSEDHEAPEEVGRKRKEKKSGVGAPPETNERLRRTVFVGNLPKTATRSTLWKLFAPFGSIKCCRIRGAVPRKQSIPKKIADIKQEFHPRLQSLIGYVVFKTEEDAKSAVTLNGSLFGDHHIVVNLATKLGEKKRYDGNRSIFIGNLPFDVENEAVWSAFSQCGEIEAVRIIRDKETGAGKGFGYILFQKIHSQKKALALDSVEIEGRQVRIKAVEERRPQKFQQKQGRPNAFNAIRRKGKQLKEDLNKRKSLKKFMKSQKLKHEKKKVANVFKNFRAFGGASK